MVTIEIDFDVFKRLTSMRETEKVTYNDVLRKILGLNQRKEVVHHPNNLKGAWTVKGVTFPPDTEFRGRYQGKTYYGVVKDGSLTIDDQQFTSPSAAAIYITDNSVNGWTFWQCKFPGQSSWEVIKSIREKLGASAR